MMAFRQSDGGVVWSSGDSENAMSSPVLIEGGGQRQITVVMLKEVLVMNPAVANLIATGKSAQIYSAMEVGGSQGMQTFEQDLARLLVAGLISEPTAFTYARNPAVFRDRVMRLRASPQANRRPAASPGPTPIQK